MVEGRGSGHPTATAPSLIAFYVLYFASVGIILPFMPAYLSSLGFSGTRVGLILALPPLTAIFFPPVFGLMADRTGRPDRVLTAISFGTLIGFSTLLYATGFAAVFAAFLVYALFASSTTTLVDSITLQRVARHGGSYSHLRVFGSIGFVASSTLFGLAVDGIDRRVVIAAWATIIAYGISSLFLHARSVPAPPRGPWEGVKLLRDPDIALLLTTTALHWIASAPFHALFSIHVVALGLSPGIIGLAAGVGVVAEVLVMLAYPRLLERISPRHILFLSYGLAVVRWTVLGTTDSGWLIVAISVLHGFTFGSFFVASIGYVARRVPDELRASGQALFVAMTFGLGGLVGFTTAGAGYDLMGGHRLFLVGAALEALTAIIVLRLRPAGSPPRIRAPAPASSGTRIDP